MFRMSDSLHAYETLVPLAAMLGPGVLSQLSPTLELQAADLHQAETLGTKCVRKRGGLSRKLLVVAHFC